MILCFQHEYIYHNTGVDIDRKADMDMDNKDIRKLWVEPVFFRIDNCIVERDFHPGSLDLSTIFYI